MTTNPKDDDIDSSNYSIYKGERGHIIAKTEEKHSININPKDLMGQKKIPITLIPPAGIRGIAEAMNYGAHIAKRIDGSFGYGPYNWREHDVRYSIYLDAIMRHTLALVDKDDLDKDSGLHHLKHIGANVTLLLDAIEHNCLVDDRPKKKGE